MTAACGYLCLSSAVALESYISQNIRRGEIDPKYYFYVLGVVLIFDCY